LTYSSSAISLFRWGGTRGYQAHIHQQYVLAESKRVLLQHVQRDITFGPDSAGQIVQTHLVDAPIGFPYQLVQRPGVFLCGAVAIALPVGGCGRCGGSQGGVGLHHADGQFAIGTAFYP